MSLLLRLSDNVLEAYDWSVLQAKLENGRVVSHEFKNRGVYSDGSFPKIGATIEDISEWLAYDGTGYHPENYHEVFDPNAGWRSFVRANELSIIDGIGISQLQWEEIANGWRRKYEREKVLFNCDWCGGSVVMTTGLGRTREYGGVMFEVPAGHPIATCQECGETYLTTAEAEDLEELILRNH